MGGVSCWGWKHLTARTLVSIILLCPRGFDLQKASVLAKTSSSFPSAIHIQTQKNNIM